MFGRQVIYFIANSQTCIHGSIEVIISFEHSHYTISNKLINDAFVRNLATLTPLPMLLWDERLTTAAAERLLIEADQSRKRRAEVIDKMAATLILQGALDRLAAQRRSCGPR